MPSQPTSEHPVNVLLRPKALVVTVLSGGALSAILSLTAPIDMEWPIRFGLISLALLWITVTFLCSLAVIRPLLYRLPASAFPWVALSLLLTATSLVALAGWQVTTPGLTGAEGLELFVARAVATALIVGMLALLIYENYLQGRQAALRQKEAELALLRARVQPHFLFNTLNTGVALLHSRPDRVEQLLLDLSDLFRATLGNASVASLEDELSLAQRYLSIEQLRFGTRLTVNWQVPDDAHTLRHTLVPALSVQPLLENAIKHGIEPRLPGGRITLSVELDSQQIVVTVSNPLPGAHDATGCHGHGIGLSAVRDRVASFGDGSGRLTTWKREDDHFVAKIVLPR